jgi:hypothetical protein
VDAEAAGAARGALAAVPDLPVREAATPLSVVSGPKPPTVEGAAGAEGVVVALVPLAFGALAPVAGGGTLLTPTLLSLASAPTLGTVPAR